jgi:hypothetical protein
MILFSIYQEIGFNLMLERERQLPWMSKSGELALSLEH